MTRNALLACALLPLLASTAGTQTAPPEIAFPRLYEGLVQQYVSQLRYLPKMQATTDRAILRMQENPGDLEVEPGLLAAALLARERAAQRVVMVSALKVIRFQAAYIDADHAANGEPLNVVDLLPPFDNPYLLPPEPR